MAITNDVGYLCSMTEVTKAAESRDPVGATFHATLLQAEREAPGAAALMSLAAFFAPDDIPLELFQQDAALYPPDLAQVASSQARLAELLGVLSNRSLINFKPDARTFSVRHTVQAAARDALGPERDAWAQRAMGIIVAAFPEPAPATGERCERLVAHVRALNSQLPAEDATRNRGWLLGATGAYLRERAALADALPLLEASLATFERLATANPGSAGSQRNLAISHQRVGDVLEAQRNRRGALAAYQAALAIFERLAAADPGNVRAQRDVAVSHERTGEVLEAQRNRRAALAAYQAALAIFARLALADPGSSELQRELAASHEKIGDVLQAQGDLPAALAAYQAALAIREGLAAGDPGNAGSQRDLSVSHMKIGDALVVQGDLAAALAAYQAALAIREGLTVSDPGNAGWQHGLALSYGRIGQVYIRQAERQLALSAFRKGREIIGQLLSRVPDHSSLPTEIAWFNGQIALAGFRSYGAKLRLLGMKLLVATQSRPK